MICASCHSTTHRIIYANGKEYCPHCSHMSEADGAKIEGLLTRNRNRMQSLLYEGDMIPPHTYNRARREIDINPDFIKLYPRRAKDVYTDQQLERAGLPRLIKYGKDLERRQKEYKEKTLKSAEFKGIGKEASKIKEIVA